jgi:outer membrane receptor protein involved in Fe transport
MTARPHHSNRLLSLLASATLAILSVLAAAPVAAQTTTATIRGQTAANAEITAMNTATGATRSTRANDAGAYVLSGVLPGEYQVIANAGGEAATQTIRVQIGQSATLNLPLAAADPDEQTLDTVEVVGIALVETRTSEVATNVTQEQIESLPQGERNFLNFAQLAPGVAVSRDPNAKGFSAHGQLSNQTNVFIDGANLKNNVLQGGLVGQDSSRGNPFSQEAIQEFRVLTQNYKAEYEQAGSALITAITKSGTNELTGSVYGYLQTRGMTEQEFFSDQRGEEEPPFRREQFGGTVGGPIIEDMLHFFFSYEGRRDETSAGVNFSDPDFQQYNGTFAKPFEQDVLFGKLSFNPNDSNAIELSFSKREDTEVLDFGGTRAYDARIDRDNEIDSVLLKWSYFGDRFINEVLVDRGEYVWTPNPARPDLVAQDFQGVGRIGGANNLQAKGQDSLTIRDDLTFTPIEGWGGSHTIKMGAKFARYEYSLVENNNVNPLYIYNRDRPTGFDAPFQAIYAPIGQVEEFDNDQFGLYVQDDWDVNDRLQLNLGLRWDYEDNALNNDFVSPEGWSDVVDELGLSRDYISTGSEREGYKNAFQPRVGFSLDVSEDGDQSTTLFGGAGRYYDRIPIDPYAVESFRAQFPTYNFYFSFDGQPVDGNPSIIWDPRYLTPEGLDELIAGPLAGRGEIIMLNNDTKPPYSDQFSFGVRQVMGDWIGSLTLSRVLGYRQHTYIWGNRTFEGQFQPPSNGYGNVLISDYRRFTSSGVYVSLDKPFTQDSNWGVGVAYTYLDAEKEGGDNFSLDYSRPDLYPDNKVGERHRLAINGIVGLPWEMRLTGLIQLGTGAPHTVIESFAYNGLDGGGIRLGAREPRGQDFIIPNAWAYRQVDLSLSKQFTWGERQMLELRLDALNVFNHNNYGCFTDFVEDPRFGEPNCTVGPTRGFQVGARYAW